MTVVSNYPVPGWLNQHQLGKSVKGNQTLQGRGPEICVFNKPPSNSDWLTLLSQDALALCPTWDAHSDSGWWPICPSVALPWSPSPSGAKPRIAHRTVGNKADAGRSWMVHQRTKKIQILLALITFLKSGYFNVAWVLMPEMHQIFLFWHLAN